MICHPRGKLLHFTQGFIHIFQLVRYGFEGAVKSSGESARQLFINRLPHLVELFLVAFLHARDRAFNQMALLFILLRVLRTNLIEGEAQRLRELLLMLVICPRHLAKLPRHLPQALSGFFPQCLLVLQSVAPVAAEFIRRLTRKLLQLLAKSGNLSRAFPPKSLLLGCKRFYLPELGILCLPFPPAA